MIFPSEFDFLERFGIEPFEVDNSLGLYCYRKNSQAHDVEVEVSFSVLAQSFQVVLRHHGRQIATVSSECAEAIRIFNEVGETGVDVEFDISGCAMRARVVFEPEISCRWWALRA